MIENGEKPRPSEEERKKTEYFSRFALRHMRAMRIFERGGILGEGNEEWRNVTEHCLVAAVGADILAERLKADRERVVLATLLHDWYKRREVEAIRELGGYGVPEDLIKLAHANTPERADPEFLAGRSREEKIVHFMDLSTLGSDFVEITDRWRDLGEKPFFKSYSESFRDRYGGKSLVEFQIEVTEAERKELRRRSGYPRDPSSNSCGRNSENALTPAGNRPAGGGARRTTGSYAMLPNGWLGRIIEKAATSSSRPSSIETDVLKPAALIRSYDTS